MNLGRNINRFINNLITHLNALWMNEDTRVIIIIISVLIVCFLLAFIIIGVGSVDEEEAKRETIRKKEALLNKKRKKLEKEQKKLDKLKAKK